MGDLQRRRAGSAGGRFRLAQAGRGDNGDRPPRRSVASLLAAALPWLLAACSAAPAALPEPPPAAPLRVGSDLDNMPFAGVDSEGRPVGRDVEMMTALAARLGRPLQWRRLAFEALLPAVESGEIDVACATLGVTAEREERIDFSDPYFVTAIEVVVRRGPGEPRRWADLDGRPVAAARGTTCARALRRVLPRALALPQSEEHGDDRQRLVSGELDGLVMDGPDAAALLAGYPDELALLTTPLAPERYALAVAEGRRELRRALDKALLELRREGILEQLDARWRLVSTD